MQQCPICKGVYGPGTADQQSGYLDGTCSKECARVQSTQRWAQWYLEQFLQKMDDLYSAVASVGNWEKPGGR